MDYPVVFLCMNVLGTTYLYFAYDHLRKGITGDFRTNKEHVLMTHVPDLVAGLMSLFLGVCFWFGSWVWF